VGSFPKVKRLGPEFDQSLLFSAEVKIGWCQMMVASKYSRNRFISEKKMQSFKLHFLQNSPLVQLHTSAGDCKGIGGMPGSHFVKAFSALMSHSY